MKESTIEQKLCKSLRLLGYLTPKLENLPGWPDRLIVGNWGKSVYIEFKTETGRLSKKQKEIHAELIKRGHKVVIAREDTKVTDIIRAMEV